MGQAGAFDPPRPALLEPASDRGGRRPDPRPARVVARLGRAATRGAGAERRPDRLDRRHSTTDVVRSTADHRRLGGHRRARPDRDRAGAQCAADPDRDRRAGRLPGAASGPPRSQRMGAVQPGRPRERRLHDHRRHRDPRRPARPLAALADRPGARGREVRAGAVRGTRGSRAATSGPGAQRRGRPGAGRGGAGRRIRLLRAGASRADPGRRTRGGPGPGPWPAATARSGPASAGVGPGQQHGGPIHRGRRGDGRSRWLELRAGAPAVGRNHRMAIPGRRPERAAIAAVLAVRPPPRSPGRQRTGTELASLAPRALRPDDRLDGSRGRLGRSDGRAADHRDRPGGRRHRPRGGCGAGRQPRPGARRRPRAARLRSGPARLPVAGEPVGWPGAAAADR